MRIDRMLSIVVILLNQRRIKAKAVDAVAYSLLQDKALLRITGF